jgi:uncharacterized membrane protein
MQPSSHRLQSIDMVRGAVMILMALDHVRVYAGVTPYSNEPAVYFTRWITNFCAPAFVFLAGTGAFLHGLRLNDRPALSRWLAIRGALLIFLELTISRLGWTFNLDFYNYTEANVIWAIGWAMLALALLVRLRPMVVGVIGVVITAGHHLLERWAPNPWEMPPDQVLGWLWQVMYVGGEFRFFGTGPKLVVLYTLIPWIGVIAVGYWFGVVMARPAAERRRACHWIGWGAITVFVVLRWFNIYGDPRPWSSTDEFFPPLLSFLWTNKYPASLLFLLMTLGPVIALLPWLDRARGAVAGWFTTFGREPLFFYLLHIPFIHAVTVLISLVRSPEHTGWLFENHPLRVSPVPEGYLYSLPLLYLVWFVVVITLYFPTRWFATWPARRTSRWLKYF